MTITGKQQSAAAGVALMCLAAMMAPALAQVPFTQLDSRLRSSMQGQAPNQILPNQKQVRANIDTRLGQLRSEVLIAVSRGWLEPGQAGRLYRQLDSVQAQETRDHLVGLTPASTVDLLKRLHIISANINNEIANTGTINKGIAASPSTNLENERLFMQWRIEEGVRLGRLSDRNVRDLGGRMHEIARMETRRGGLNAEGQQVLKRRMAELNNRIDRFM